MTATRYQTLIDALGEPEPYVRQALQWLEADFRSLALRALADWEQLGIAADDLFQAIATLQRPSWGAWNGLLSALRRAQKEQLRTVPPEVRRRIEQAQVLRAAFDLLDERLDDSLVARLGPLCRLTRTSVPAKPRVEFLLTLPIGLRNRVAHDMPSDPGWWREAAAALRPLVEFHAEQALDPVLCDPASAPSPWFLTVEGEVCGFNGLERDFAVIYVNSRGEAHFSEARSADVLRSLARLLGKEEARETDFRSLLSRLAPEEVRGVLLGDYLVGRPLGTTSLATTHVGRQLSTGRKVAIKILHDGMPAEVRQQFQQEARLLSQFNHPGIVAILGYGEEAWSAPRSFSLSDEPWFQTFARNSAVKAFIAMEWLEGLTLEQVFQLPAGQQPPLETVVRWFHQAALALAAAHTLGVVHGNLKPNSLMVRDDVGAKLIDFGIARAPHRSTPCGRGPATISDGWPYLSPEQIRTLDAEAECGPATDVYSLCATFYEIVTSQRLYEHDRRDVAAVGQRKLAGERPAVPRRAQRRLPWELETLILGGLEAEPSVRIRSTELLANDLQHYLRNEPIEYRRPSVWRRMQLTYRRNRAVANVVAVSLAILVSSTAIYIRNVQNEQAKAEESFRNARAAVDELFTRVSEDTLLNQPGMQDLRKELLQKTLAYYQRFLAQRADDPRVQSELAVTNFRAGRIIEELESPAAALQYHRQAQLAQERLLAACPDDPARIQALGDTLNALGRVLQRLKKPDAAMDAYRSAIRSRQRLVELVPEDVEYCRALANSTMNVGLIEQQLGHTDEAFAHLDQAQATRRALLMRQPEPAKVRRDFAMGEYNLALLTLGNDQPDQAQTHLTAAIDSFQQLLTRDSSDLAIQYLLAVAVRRQADQLAATDANDEATAKYFEARELLNRLVDRSPTVTEYRAELANLQVNLSRRLSGAAAREALVQAHEIYRQLVEKQAHDPRLRRDFAVTLFQLALHQQAAHETAAAKANVELAIGYFSQLAAELPDDDDIRQQLADAQAALETLAPE